MFNSSNRKILHSHKRRQSQPNIEAMTLAALREIKKITKQLNKTQKDGMFTQIDVDRLVSILGDMSAFTKNGLNIPIMRSEEYRAIVDSTAIVSKTDQYGNIIYANELFCKISGYDVLELIGKNHNIIKHPDTPESLFVDMWKIISKEKKIWRGEIKNLSKSGKEYWVDAVIVPQIDANKEIVGYAAFRYDITEKVHQRDLIEHEQQLNQIILDGQSGIVIVISKTGNLIKANKAFFETFKTTSIEEFNKRYNTIYDLLGHKKILDIEQNINETVNKVWLFDDNVKKTFSFTIKAINYNIDSQGIADKRYIITMHDITDAEEEIKNARMESFAKSSFLATMSHEVRTPLNGITGFIELLSQTDLDSQQNEYVGIVKKSAVSLLSVINDILDFSKIEAGSFEIEKIDFNPIKEIESIVDLFVAKASEQKINLCVFVEPNLPSCVLGDPLRIKQIIANLIGNALKFTPKDGEVSVLAETAYRNKDKVGIKISISDSGAGMSKETQEIIFSPFTQADNTISRKYGGTGLGLAISQNLANLMGSKIEFRSELGKGSEFWLTIELKICNSAPYFGRSIDESKEIAIYIAEESQSRCAYILIRYLESFKFNYIIINSQEDITSTQCDILMVISSGKNQIEQINTSYMQNHQVISIIPAGVMNRNRFPSHKTIVMPINGSKIFDAIIDTKEKVIDMAIENKNSQKKEQYAARVLVAEDNTTNQKLAIFLLGRFGITPVLANDGEEAFNCFKAAHDMNEPYDLIFMDIHMPILDGIDATKEIRGYEKDLKLVHVPIIALTADVIKGQEQKYYDAGMDSFLSKPIDFDKFDSKVTEFLSHLKTTTVQEVICPIQNSSVEDDSNENQAFIESIAQALELDIDTATILAADFHNNWVMQSKDLEAAINNDDKKTIQNISHSIKGAAGSLRVDDVYKICSEIENMVKSGIEDGYADKFRELKSLMGDVAN